MIYKPCSSSNRNLKFYLELVRIYQKNKKLYLNIEYRKNFRKFLAKTVNSIKYWNNEIKIDHFESIKVFEYDYSVLIRSQK